MSTSWLPLSVISVVILYSVVKSLRKTACSAGARRARTATTKNTFLIALSESERTQFGGLAFSEQTGPQQVFSAIWEMEADVNNGGFHQYFSNSGGDTAAFAPVALRTIGAAACADIVERAMRLVSNAPISSAREERQRLLDGLPAQKLRALSELDEQFYSYPDNLTVLLFEFVQSHPEEFGQTPANLPN